MDINGLGIIGAPEKGGMSNMRECKNLVFGLLGALGIVACGSSADPAAAAGGAFAGTWKCSTTGTDGSFSTTFDSVYVGQDLGNGQVSLIRPDLDCPAVKFTVSGSTATALPGQSCTRTSGSFSYMTYTATSDGAILKLDERDSSGLSYKSTCYHP